MEKIIAGTQINTLNHNENKDRDQVVLHYSYLSVKY